MLWVQLLTTPALTDSSARRRMTGWTSSFGGEWGRGWRSHQPILAPRQASKSIVPEISSLVAGNPVEL